MTIGETIEKWTLCIGLSIECILLFVVLVFGLTHWPSGTSRAGNGLRCRHAWVNVKH